MTTDADCFFFNVTRLALSLVVDGHELCPQSLFMDYELISKSDGFGCLNL